MKLYKSTILAVAAALTLGMTACNDDDYKGAAEPDGVFFPNDLPTSYEVLVSDNTFEVPVERIGSTEAATYNLTAVYDTDIFTVPSTVTFEAGKTESVITIGYNPEYMEQYFGFDISLSFAENDASAAGDRTFQFQVMVSPPWSDWVPYSIDGRDPQGTYYYSVGWYYEGTQTAVQAYYRYNTEDTQRFQLNLANWGEGEVVTGKPYTVDGKEVNRGLILNVNNGEVEVPLQDTGIDIEFTNGTFRLGIMDWNTYRQLNGAQPDPTANCTFDPETGLYNLYLAYAVNVDGEWYAQASGWETFQMDGYPDYSMTVAYSGLSTNADATESLALFEANVGDGVAEARFAISRVLTIAELTEGLKDGSVTDYASLNAGEEQTFSLVLNGAGQYVVVGVAFDENGEAQSEVSAEFDLTTGISEWKPVGNAEYYDAWITAAFSFGSGEDKRGYLDFPWNVEVLESITKPGLYALKAPYCSTSWVMNNDANRQYGDFQKVNILIDCTDPDFVIIEPQFTGYTLKAGAVGNDNAQSYYMANRAGLYLSNGETKEDIIAAGMADKLVGNVITIDDPMVHTSDDEPDSWGTWNTNPPPVGKITFDFLSAAGEETPAAVKAKVAANQMMQAYGPARKTGVRIFKKARVLRTDKML